MAVENVGSNGLKNGVFCDRLTTFCYAWNVKQCAILSRLVVKTASNSFHLSMSPSSINPIKLFPAWAACYILGFCKEILPALLVYLFTSPLYCLQPPSVWLTFYSLFPVLNLEVWVVSFYLSSHAQACELIAEAYHIAGHTHESSVLWLVMWSDHVLRISLQIFAFLLGPSITWVAQNDFS